MNHYFILCVIFGVTFALHTSGEKRLGNLPSEEFPINYLYDKINALEGQLKRLEEKDDQMKTMIDEKDEEMKMLIDKKDDEMKKMIEEKDDKMNILESRVTNLTSQLENFQGHSAMEPAFIVTAIWANGHIPDGVIKFDEKIIDHSNSFNIEDGIFRVPVTGNYLFLFDSYACNLGASLVQVYLNGNKVYEFYEVNGDSSHQYHQHIFMFATKLVEGDDLLLYNSYPLTLRNDVIHPITFVGYKTY